MIGYCFSLAIATGITLMTISLDSNLQAWRAVNDGVMGGVSTGRMVRAGDTLRFEGELSLENNGGFASVRRPVDQDLSRATLVRVQVRGDGRKYQFRIRQDSGFDGVAWRAEFTSSSDWQTLDLPLDEFIPVFRGRQVPGAGPVDPSSIQQVGFLLADKQPGRFALDIRSIEFVSTEEPGSRH
jgi:NADH dehydrogenase [ubiquinone] 1 alpha subcomplex assembly factor 1